ncbi:hypothetical protein PM082_010868 [Marasmius tenuissimus]|nr:hypothetical protein PM082_010868 [Marasmius tenuissimus]
MDKMSLGLEDGPLEFIRKFVPGERADRDWTPSSGLLPQGFNTQNHSQWVAFRDSQRLDKLMELSVSLQPSCVLGAIADITRCLDMMKASKNAYEDTKNQHTRVKFLRFALTSIRVLWDNRMEYLANERDLTTFRFQHTRIHIRRYVNSILEMCLADQPTEYTALSLPALDLYHWLYLVTIDAKERQNPSCELSERIRMKLDGLTMWSTVVPRLFADLPLQTLEHRLLAALVPRSAPLPIQMLRDTASILYNMEPAMICQLRPFFFTCFIKASQGAMYDSLASRGQRNKEEVDRMVSMTIVALNKCLEHRGLLFLDELYQHTAIPGTNLPIPVNGFDRKGELFDVILMSAWSAFNLKKPVYLDFLWKNVEYLTTGGQHLRSTLASDLDATFLRKLYNGIAPKFQEESAFECMKALHAIARLSGVEAGPLPKGVVYGCANYSCRAFCLTRGEKRKAEMFQTCAGCKKVLYCNQSCQRRHWRDHRTLCKGRA